MKTILKFSILLLSLIFTLSSCMDETPDRPEREEPHYTGAPRTHSIKQLKAMYTGTLKQIDSAVVISAIVVGNDESGNIYKGLHIQDETAAIEIKIDKTSMYNLYKVGQRVYVNCKGLYLGTYGGVTQLGDIYNGAIGRVSEIKIKNHLFVDGFPKTENIPAVKEISGTAMLNDSMLNCLVTLTNVSFADAGKSYAEPLVTTSRNINFADGTSVVAYNSGYAKFQASILPSGKGNVTGILSKFNSTWQILIRSINDVSGFVPEEVVPLTGDGSKANPYVCTDAKQKQGETGKWVKGYIVGVIESDGTTNTPNFTGPFTIQSNLLIAATASETDLTKCITVQLPTGTVRTDLNLNGNPLNLGKEILLYGDLAAYFGQAGLKNASAYWWVESNTGYDPNVGAIFAESFAASQGAFTSQSVVGTQAWVFASGYGMKMTGYASGNNANEDWLISPAIDLSAKSTAKCSFNHAVNYSTDMTKLTLWVSTNYSAGLPSTATWTKLTIPTYPPGSNWTFVGSGNVDLASVVGNSNVRIAFKYESTTSVGATWEIKDFLIKE